MSKKFDLQTIFDIKGIHMAKPMRENKTNKLKSLKVVKLEHEDPFLGS